MHILKPQSEQWSQILHFLRIPGGSQITQSERPWSLVVKPLPPWKEPTLLCFVRKTVSPSVLLVVNILFLQSKSGQMVKSEYELTYVRAVGQNVWHWDWLLPYLVFSLATFAFFFFSEKDRELFKTVHLLWSSHGMKGRMASQIL